MDSLSGVSASSLFSAIPLQTSQLNTLSNIALTRGIDSYQNGSYEDAIKEFKRAVGLSPQSENALKAYDFLAFNASIEMHPVMAPADLMKAVPAIEQAVKKYG